MMPEGCATTTRLTASIRQQRIALSQTGFRKEKRERKAKILVLFIIFKTTFVNFARLAFTFFKKKKVKGLASEKRSCYELGNIDTLTTVTFIYHH